MSGDEHDHRFPGEARIKRRREFLAVQQRGERIFGRRLIIMWMPGATNRTRIGITVSRKVGNAVLRNRVKRWVREVFRQNQRSLPIPLDLVVTAKRGIADFSLQTIQDELEHVLKRLSERAQRPPVTGRRRGEPRPVPGGGDRGR